MPAHVRCRLDGLAELLEYPSDPLEPRVRRHVARLDASNADALSALERFAREIQGKSDTELQEAYTDTFDLSPACSLDVGWHLFGDRPDRATFMIALREALERAGVPERSELPDHLSRVLELLGREEPERAAALASLVLPAVASVRRALVDRSSVYVHLLTATEALIASFSAGRTSEATTP